MNIGKYMDIQLVFSNILATEELLDVLLDYGPTDQALAKQLGSC